MKKLLSSRKRAITILIAAVMLVSLACVSSCSGALLDEVKKDVQEEKDKKALEEQNKKRTETTKPIISVLSWQTITDAKSNSPTAAFNVTAEAKAISAKSAATIAGYLCKEESTVPALDAAGWVAAAPTSFTFTVMTDSSLNGTHTLYVWVKDSFGNISDASALELTLEPLAASWASPYANGVTVTAHEKFSLAAIEDLSATGASATGTLGVGSVAFSGTGNRTITVSPGATGTGLWTAGSQTLTLSVKTALGLTLTKTLSLTVFNGVCVSDPTTPVNAVDDGTQLHPYRIIKTAITTAETKYRDAGIAQSEVRVGAGTYTSEYVSNGAVITLRGGVSVYGSYNADFASRVTGTPTSIVQDTSTTTVPPASYYRAVEANTVLPKADANTILDGFSIKSCNIPGLSENIVGVYLEAAPIINNCRIESFQSALTSSAVYIDEASPTIQNCIIIAGTGTTSTGIYINGTSSITPLIHSCEITAGNATLLYSTGLYLDGYVNATVTSNRISGGTTVTSGCSSYSIYLSNSNPTIYNNIILGGKNYDCSSIYIDSGNPVIRNNTIDQGISDGGSAAHSSIYIVNGSPNIDNNIIKKASSGTAGYGIYEEGSSGDPVSIKNNDFYNYSTSALYYDEGTTPKTTLTDLHLLTGSSSSNNVTIDPGFTTTSDEYHLLSTSGIRTLGLNGLAQSPGWGFNMDKDGNTRSPNDTTTQTGWSIGAYEQN